MHSAAAAHGSSGLGSILSAETIASAIKTKPQEMSAAKKFALQMFSETEPFTLVATGALTTIA